jgi:septum formation protein
MSSRSLVLASNSPRRAFLLKECGFEFIVQPTHASEEFDDDINLAEVPAFLAGKKAEAAFKSIKPNQLIVTADTVVIFDNQILNKPNTPAEAIDMLTRLSGNTHKVITAVCLTTKDGFETIEEISWVTFRDLDPEDIKNYVEHFKPMDKAGAYGAQECLPDNYNPLSGHERDFLTRINKGDLLQKSKPAEYPVRPLVAIEEIAGSYFNVMGLPIARLYDKIKQAL